MRHLSLLFNKVDRVAIPIFRYYIHTMFVIEDESHAEPQSGVYQTFDDALKELRRRAEISWDKEPNQAHVQVGVVADEDMKLLNTILLQVLGTYYRDF